MPYDLHTCHRCPRSRGIVMPIGPVPCPLLFLDECPAKDEDRYGEPFVGKTGKEATNTYFPFIGIPRSDAFIMNAVLCSRADYSNPEPIDADACMGVNLTGILAAVRPSIIVPMGAIACSLWPEIELSRHHGLPMPGSWGAWQGVLFPCYHPSAGIHAGGMMIALMNDFAALGTFYRNAQQLGLVEA